SPKPSGARARSNTPINAREEGVFLDMALAPGTRLGRYEIRSPLGAGGMGEVYLAQDTALRRPVAVKLLPAEFATDHDRLRRFEREAHAASALNHPNILTVHEIGEEDGLHFIAAEFVDGESLRQRIVRGPLELREVLGIGIQISAALSAAHAAGVVHRDIKPENVMLRPDGIVKVLDFGLAKLSEQQSPTSDAEAPTQAFVKTTPGAVMGTTYYMSPEQARGLALDARTDLWSLGVVLYEMITGQLPFAGETAGDVIAAILKTEPPLLTSHAPDAPAELERIVDKALRKDREERYQGVKDFSRDVKRRTHRPRNQRTQIRYRRRSGAIARGGRLRLLVFLQPCGERCANRIYRRLAVC
ncbi:MAG: serine/threonine protein kinase, partial [Acidobacteria bacterium]|nr:serine/threonine protein kinase [Acidobacteriota bacterium]